MKDAIYTLIAIPIFLSFVLLEYFYQRRKHQNHYRLNDAITNLNIGVGHIVFNLFTRAFILGAFFWVSERVAFFHIPSGLLSVLIILVVYDFCFYWAHRMSHEINFLWGAHIVHHQSEDYNLTVALRQSWIHSTLAFVFFMPLAFLGIDINKPWNCHLL
jgi:alkylglycerol monooxygenase